ncbi:MAG: hypothetical protein HW412_1562, partial [Bacteroidetes bacterium]|nr:hypothetical protein [Bacteroidota bacterium]
AFEVTVRGFLQGWHIHKERNFPPLLRYGKRLLAMAGQALVVPLSMEIRSDDQRKKSKCDYKR